MKVFRKATVYRGIKRPVITLGNFDGLHIGHQMILKRLTRRARALNCRSVVYTFEPHPLKVVAPHKSPPLILDNEDKETLIGDLGIDCLIFARFTREFASKHPREFVEEILVRGLRAKEVWVGSNFSFGRGRLGTVEYLKELGKEYGFRVVAVRPHKKGGLIVSSSRVRDLIRDGGVKEASALLGRNYSIKGRVIRGKDIGKIIGFPTANLKVSSELIPKDGVYAAYADLNGKRYRAVVNIGVAPTFGGKNRVVEAHLLGFKRDIYGKMITVSFLKRLRDETEFESKEALIRQIKKDIEKAKRCFH